MKIPKINYSTLKSKIVKKTPKDWWLKKKPKSDKLIYE